YVIRAVTIPIFWIKGETILTNNGKDDTEEKTVNFDSLELDQDEGNESSKKMTELLTHLKENMEPEKYAEVMTLLGVGKDMSNTDLFEKIKTLFAKKPEEEEEEEEDPEKKAAAAEEGEKPDRAAFMKECMAKEGMDLAKCTEEFTKKYPDPEKKEEGAEELELPADVKAQLKTLTDQVAELTKGKDLAKVSTEVEKLVEEKHLAPVQRDAIINLSAKMNPEDRAELLGFFRSTQKLNVHNDAGLLSSRKPGEVSGNDLTVERKKELIELHGLSGLIMDKADRSRPWAKELNN
ncbi:MAG: hypothetical protein KAX31_01440, partial [Thermoplasmata archaeon]|nr:hypothetical protein [Thermoplasmata archaeon]